MKRIPNFYLLILLCVLSVVVANAQTRRSAIKHYESALAFPLIIQAAGILVKSFVADMGTHDLWLAAFRDSENNLLALISHVPKG